MALISHRYKFLYFLSARTASTATASFLTEIAEQPGLPGDHVFPKENISQGRDTADYREYYDDKVRKIIAAVFGTQIEQLGYEF